MASKEGEQEAAAAEGDDGDDEEVCRLTELVFFCCIFANA